MKKIIFLILLIISTVANAQDGHSMRRCVLLPISDGVGGAIGTKVYAELETYFKENNWCTYQSNSDLLSVFARYRENLPQHLKRPEVIKTVAEKLKAGSIIRITLMKEIGTLEIQLDIIGSNGEDILFSERAVIEKDDIEIIVQTLQGWFEIYGRLIPYDGKITGILGDQITLDIGRDYSIKMGQDFIVKRFKGMKKHPLLKKVVEWESRPLASGKVFSLSDQQALGVVKVYKSDSKLAVGDWVRLEPIKEDAATDDLRYPKDQKDSFGKLGIASFFLNLGQSSFNPSTTSGAKRLGGLMFGFSGKVEAWVTRNWFGMAELGRSLGSLKKSSGVLSSSKSDYQRGTFKVGGGYKYLPLGFFYGPQVDVYGGYASNTYKPDYNSADGLGEYGVSGIFLGVGSNFPVGRDYRGLVRAEFIPFPSFSDDDSVYGSAKSSSWLQLEMGVKYQYSPILTLDGLIEMTNSRSSFKGSVKSVSAQDTALKLGASLNF
ncbi:MAG: hypothetical protein K2P81_04205 [Bacteriovoracaceae bacterium]|nr:hypothetical protein [Bacteriovoracaceae bacterium]